MSLRDRLSALLGVSAYSPPPSNLPSLDDAQIEKLRESLGGQLSPLPLTRTRWYLADLEAAIRAADVGDLSMAAQLSRSMRRDGVLAGLLSTRAGGLVRLPKRFTGADEIVRALEGRDGVRSVFDDMFPASELELLAGDGDVLGIGVAELVPVAGRAYPVLVRLDPEWLRYRWSENRWYYLSIAGPIPITPGDGRWVLHTAGGRMSPWQKGLWSSLGRSWINKEHANLHLANWEAKLANPARVAVAPNGATESQRFGFLKNVIAWGINTCFELPPGYDIRILESNGRGFESFGATITRSDQEFMIAICGQVVTVTGGTGFANADIHKSIRADLIKASADSLAYTLNTQAIPAWVIDNFGEEALDQTPIVEWDTTPPKDLKADADAIGALGDALTKVNEALSPYSLRVDAEELASRFGVPLVVAEKIAQAPEESSSLLRVV